MQEENIEVARKNTMVDTAYAVIKDKIISYHLQPNAVVSDNQLAAELGMSRAPVREAILQLTADGLIETGASGKLVVSPIGLQDIVDILRVRKALESEAIRIIAENGWLSASQEKKLKAIYEKLISSAQTHSFAQNYQYDDEFHTTIIGFCGNKRIKDVIDRMNLQMQRARWLNIAVPARQQESREEHDEIYAGIMQKDLEKSVLAVETHLGNSERTFKEVFQNPDLKKVMAGIYNFFS